MSDDTMMNDGAAPMGDEMPEAPAAEPAMDAPAAE